MCPALPEVCALSREKRGRINDTRWNVLGLLVDRLSQRPTLDDLDAGAPRVGDVGDHVAGRALARRLVEVDDFRFELLRESGMVLDVESRVVEQTMDGRRLTPGGIGAGGSSI